MFDKMKEIYELQKQAREVQKRLEEIRLEQAEGGVKVRINGALKVESIDIDPAYLNPDRKERLESLLSRLITQTVQEVQKRCALESQDLLKKLSAKF